MEIGDYSPKTKSNGFLDDRSRLLVTALLFAGGVLVVWLQQIWRVPLHLPGHHGIEWMALLVLASSASHRRFSASITASGAAVASLMPFWAGDAFAWGIYLAAGLIFDAAFACLPSLRRNLVFLACLGAAAHGSKPLIRWLIDSASGLHYGSLMAGVGYPLAMHMLFGAIGAMAAGLIIRASTLAFRRA